MVLISTLTTFCSVINNAEHRNNNCRRCQSSEHRLNTSALRSSDNIPAYFLKQVGFASVHIMTYFFKLSLHQGAI